MIVVIKKETQTYLVHGVRLGKRQAFSDKPTKSLPQGEVPSLDVSGQSGFFTCCCVLLVRDNQIVSFPEVTVTMTVAISSRDSLPQLFATSFASISDNVSYYLTCKTTKRDPNPSLVGAFENK